MDLWLDLEILALLGTANGAPILGKKLLGSRFSRPLDGGRTFTDGRPVLGESKTIRGIVLSVLATAVCSAVLGFAASIGLIAGLGAMAGDLLSSFAKRRLGRPPSSQLLGLDQIPESLLPALLLKPLLGLSIGDVTAIVALFFAGEIVLSRILFRWHVRDRPY
jgi:CDP-2,3-bis-(O-geranylgeranyl)-sn-glycerol synthase